MPVQGQQHRLGHAGISQPGSEPEPAEVRAAGDFDNPAINDEHVGPRENDFAANIRRPRQVANDGPGPERSWVDDRPGGAGGSDNQIGRRQDLVDRCGQIGSTRNAA
jgi:hypothetical protein